MYPDTEGPVLFFDGVCNLCNRAVQFVIKKDRKQQFLFASLQSTAGERAISEIKTSFKIVPDSILLYYRGQYYIKSDAALQTLKLLGGVWSFLYRFIFIPRFIRDGIYDFVARKRYKWFGKRDVCMLPTQELTSRFLG